MREERLVLEAASARVQGMRGGRGLTLGGVEASTRSMLFMSLGDGEGMQLPGLDGDGRRGETGYEGDNDSSEGWGNVCGSEAVEMANGLI